MPKTDLETDIDEVRAFIKDVLDQEVVTIGMPGGEKRPIYRVKLADRTVIVSRRKDTKALRHERTALDRLNAAGCDTVPKVLAVRGDLTMISDLGNRRLNVVLHQRDPDAAAQLIRDACLSLLSLQTAAAKTDWADIVAPVASSHREIRHFARGPQRLAKLYGLTVPPVDVDALQDILTVRTPRFVKWDCRSANAALDANGKVGWFDFEHCGTRAGYEDFAWLLTDEALPICIAPFYDSLLEIIAKAAPNATATDRDTFVRGFEVFATLQASLRLRVIRNEIVDNSWTSLPSILKYDLVGANPHMAARLAATGKFLAARNHETQDFVGLFDEVEQIFVRALSLPNTPPDLTPPSS